jgi:hypothetical protein
MKVGILYCVVAGLLGFAQLASAQECSDVLRNGTFRQETYNNSIYVRQLVAARYASMTTEEKNASKDASGKAVVYGIPYEGAYNEQQAERRSEEIRQSIDIDNTLKSAVSIFVNEGDPTIVNAWKECMATRGGGVRMWFDGEDPERPRLLVVYDAPPTAPDSQVVEADVAIENAQANSGAEFLKKGSVLTDDIVRILVLRRTDSKRPVTVTLNTSVGAGSAFLAAAQKIPPVMCHLTASASQTGQCQTTGEVYVGPHSANLHWGTCISASPCQLTAVPTQNKAACTPPSVYVGPNREDLHGGHCLTASGSSQTLTSRLSLTKTCAAGEVYAGPNAADKHGGSCVALTPN